MQQQLQYEANSKRNAAQAQAQAQAQAHSVAQSAYAMQQMNVFNQPQHPQAPPIYNNMYPGQGPPPPYGSQTAYGAPQMNIPPPQPMSAQMTQGHYGNQHQQSLYAQATTRAGRQRATTMDQQGGGIPASIQRVASHLDPSQPIRLQPSPAYYPPPPDGYADNTPGSARRGSRAGGSSRHNRDFISTLEAGALGDTYGQRGW